MRKIIVAGSLNMDLVIKVNEFPKKGETIEGTSYFTAAGGKGANQAIAASRLGGDVYLCGVLGKDSYGDELLESLKKSQVHTDFISREDTTSGTAFVTVDAKGSNSIVIIAGSNAFLDIAKVDSALKKINKDDIALTQLESPSETVLHFLKEARKKGAYTVLNPSPITSLKKELLQHVDLLVVNEVEAEKIGGVAVANTEKAMEALFKTGVTSVILTIGDKGAIYGIKGKCESFSTMKVKAVDTTAAGDSFIGGFLAALSNGKSIEESMKFGNIAGALSTTKFGAQPSIPSLKEVESYL